MKQYVLILTMFFGYVSLAQTPSNLFNVYVSKPERPLVVINGDIIASVDILKDLPVENQTQWDVLENEELSSKNLFPLDKKANGIIRLDSTSDLEVKTQSELNTFFGLDSNNNIYVNGYLLEDKEQMIAVHSIKKIELREADGFILLSPALNITIE